MKTTGLIAIVFGYHKKSQQTLGLSTGNFVKKNSNIGRSDWQIGMEENFISDRESDRPFFWDRDTPSRQLSNGTTAMFGRYLSNVTSTGLRGLSYLDIASTA